jgi:hypothetical protein
MPFVWLGRQYAAWRDDASMLALRYCHRRGEMAGRRPCPGIWRSAVRDPQCDKCSKIARCAPTEACTNATAAAKPAANFGVAFRSGTNWQYKKSLADRAISATR